MYPLNFIYASRTCLLPTIPLSASVDSIADIVVAVKSSGSRVVSDGFDEILVVKGSGTGNAERAFATFILLQNCFMCGKEVIIFLLMDGVSMARRGVASGVKHPTFNRLDHMTGEVVRAGAIIYACELCAKFRGIPAATLVEGVILTGAATYLQLLSDPSSAIIIF